MNKLYGTKQLYFSIRGRPTPLVVVFFFAFLFFSSSSNAQSTIVYFEDFRAWSDFDIYFLYSPPDYDNNWYPAPDADYWSATTGDVACGSTPSKYFGTLTGIVSASNPVFIGRNVGTSCTSQWTAPDQDLTGGGLSGTGWITLNPATDVTLSASYGRSSSMTNSSDRFIKFQYRLNGSATLIDWDVSHTGAFSPSSGTLFLTLAAGNTSIQIVVTMSNLGTSGTPEYHWFDNVKVEQCSGSPTSNITFLNPTLSYYPSAPSGCSTGCDSTTMKFTQTMPGSSTCGNRLVKDTWLYVNFPAGIDASTCAGILISSATYANSGISVTDPGAVVGQNFSYYIPVTSLLTSPSQVAFQVPETIYGGTMITGSADDVTYTGATFSIYTYGITLGNNITSTDAISITNFSGGTTSATYSQPTPTYTCPVATNYSLNTGAGTSQFNLTLSNTTGCATATYTFNQRTTTSSDCKTKISTGYLFTIMFPVGTATNTILSGSGSIFFPATGLSYPIIMSTALSLGNVFSFYSPVDIPANTQFQIILNNVTNGNNISSGSSSVYVPNASGGSDSSIAYPTFTTSACAVGTPFTFQSTSVTLCNNISCAKSTYTFSQKTSSNANDYINSGQTFTITFPAGTNAATCSGGTYNGTAITISSATATTITFVTPVAVGSNTTFSIVLYNITNPASSGTITTSVPNPTGNTTTGSYALTITSCSSTAVTFTSPSLTLSTYTGCNKATYSWTQTIPSNQGGIDSGTIVTLVFTGLSNSDLTSITNGLFNGVAINMSTLSITGTTVTFKTPTSVNCPGTFSFSLTGINNPGSATGSVSVSIPNFTTGNDTYNPYSFVTYACCAGGCACPNGAFVTYSGTRITTYATASANSLCYRNLIEGQTYCYTFSYPASGSIELDWITNCASCKKIDASMTGSCTSSGLCLRASGSGTDSLTGCSGSVSVSTSGGSNICAATYSSAPTCGLIYNGITMGTNCSPGMTAGQSYTMCITVPTGCGGMSLCPLLRCSSNCSTTTGPLPVEWLSFEAKPNGKTVLLKWSTASEINNQYFSVLKSSDGVNYEEFTRVNGAGNSMGQRNYSAVDPTPFEGINYYRLKQTDFDGKFDFSNIVAVDMLNSDLHMAFIYFHQNIDLLEYKLSNSANKNLKIEILDLLGRVIMRKESKTNEEDYEGKISTENLKAGVYIIRAIDGEESVFNKFFVE